MSLYARDAKENDKQYPPATVCCLLSAYPREMQDSKLCFQLFDKSYLRFLDLWKTLDTLMWVSGMVGTENPLALMHATCVFCRPLYFYLRGGPEYRDFIHSQPVQTSDGTCGKKSSVESMGQRTIKEYKFAELILTWSAILFCIQSLATSQFRFQIFTFPSSLVILKPFTCSLCKQCHLIHSVLGTRLLLLVLIR